MEFILQFGDITKGMDGAVVSTGTSQQDGSGFGSASCLRPLHVEFGCLCMHGFLPSIPVSFQGHAD